MACIAAISILIFLPRYALPFPSGPPVSVPGVCRDMEPTGHEPRTARGPAPYTIEIDRLTYGPEQPVQVTVRADRDVTFQGFFLQARRQARGRDMTEALGEFKTISSGTRFLDCDTVGSAWGHDGNKPKSVVSATWTPPTNNQGPIIFRATMVKGPASEFWMNVESATLYFSLRPPKEEEPTEQTTPEGATSQICVGMSGASCSFGSRATVTTMLLVITSLLLAVWCSSRP